MQGVWIPSLVVEVRSHVPCDTPPQKKKPKEEKQYCDKFNKDFKNGPHPNKKINYLQEQLKELSKETYTTTILIFQKVFFFLELKTQHLNISTAKV